jgi:hypothetical protein
MSLSVPSNKPLKVLSFFGIAFSPSMDTNRLNSALLCWRATGHKLSIGWGGWLYEEQRRFYLCPAVYGLTLASGHIRTGVVTHADLVALNQETGVAVFLGVQAGNHLIYLTEAGSDPVAGFEARSNIRRPMLATAGGKVLLAAQPDAEREAYLRRRRPTGTRFG